MTIWTADACALWSGRYEGHRLNIEDLLPEETLKVGISVLDDGTRAVTWED